MEKKETITFFGRTTFRGEKKKFGIKDDDKRRHVYILGKTGMGKTELLKNMVAQEISNGHGMGFVDPHGEAAEEILNFIPEERIKDVVYFNPADIENPIAFNIMEDVNVDYRHLIAGGLMGVFKKIWPDVWSSRMEYILNNAILALLEVPGSTLLSINRLLSDTEWRNEIVAKLKDPIVKTFWLKEFARYNQRYEVEATAAIQNKIGQFISTPLIRNIIGQSKSSIDMRKIMDEGKILIMNLAKGRIGEDNSRLLGALLITKLQLATMSRVDIPEKKRRDFILYIDEFQNFSTDSFANILSEARKYRLSLILAHQYIAQMEEKVRDAVFGNIGTMVIFRVGADDAEFLEREFSPEISIEDMVGLSKQNIYVKLMIDGLTSRPFSAETLPPVKTPEKTYVNEIIEFSRKTYGTPRSIVEGEIVTASGVNLLSAPVSYNVVCQNCGKSFKVPFKPDGKRPVYCKDCLNGKKNDDDNDFESLPVISLKKTAKTFKSASKKKHEEEIIVPGENIENINKASTPSVKDLKEIIKKAKDEKKKEKRMIRPGEKVKFD